jgi:hypothetical protein
VTVTRQLLLDVAPKAVKHLYLVVPRPLAQPRRGRRGIGDQLVVMGAESGIAAVLE